LTTVPRARAYAPPYRLFWRAVNAFRFVLPLALAVLAGCYPLSLTDARWAIERDDPLWAGKQAWLEGVAPSGERPPNLIVLLCDDLGRHEVSTYGGGPVPTPRIDALGASGVVFEAGYVTSPTCAPSRAGLMTGRVQNRFGFESQMIESYPGNAIEFLAGRHLLDMDGWELTSPPPFPAERHRRLQGIPPSELTLAEALRALGYRTGVVGKWHMGISPEQRPLARGFEEQYGFHGAFSLYAPVRGRADIVNAPGNDFAVRYQWRRGRKGDGAILRNGCVVEEDRYLTFAIRDEALDFLDRHRDEPFFLYAAFSAPHVPFQAPRAYVERFAHVEDPGRRVYHAMIAALDDAVGAIHDRVRDLGLEDNTLIVLLSDNGGATYTGATDNGPWKGGKLTQFEGGVRVPFLLSWPGKVPSGERYPHPVSATDLFPTALAAAGATPPADRPYDGVDLLPFLEGRRADRPHDRLFWRCDHIWALRDGDHKLILSTRDGWAELYDLAADRYETVNLAERMPDLLATLRRLHEEWQEDALPREPLWPRLVDHRFLIDGKVYRFPS
jgi:arylsulfatase A-like enzyme